MRQILLEGGNLQDLLLEFEKLIKKRIEPFKEIQSNKALNLITRKEVALLLKISLPTLNEWTKAGYLKSYRIGKRILYKLPEVENALTLRNFTKYQRGGCHEA